MRKLFYILTLMMVLLMPGYNTINKNLIAKMGESVHKYDNLLLNYKDNLVQAYQNSLMSINVDLAKMYANLGGDVTLTAANKFNRLDKLFSNITKELRGLGVNETDIIGRGITSSFSDSYYHGAYAYENSFNASMGFTALNKDAIQASLVNPLSKIKWQASVKDNIHILNNNVRSTITEGLIQGHGYQKTARKVAKTILNFQNPNDIKGAATKAFRIVSTETHRAFNLGADTSFNQAKKNADKFGLEKFLKTWTSSFDLNTRDSHQSADGTKADKDGIFHLFGAEFESPGNSGIAGEDINCRCAYSVQMGEIKNKKRFDNISKKPTANVSYCSWFANKYKANAPGCKKTSLPVKKISKGKFKLSDKEKLAALKGKKEGLKQKLNKSISEKEKTIAAIDKIIAEGKAKGKLSPASSGTGIIQHVAPKKKTIIPSNSLQKTSSTKVLTEEQFNKNYDLQKQEFDYLSSRIPAKQRDKYLHMSLQELETIQAYTNSGYRVNRKLAVNKVNLTGADIAFTQNLNSSLHKLDPFQGLTKRVVPKSGVNLSNYQAGSTIEWEAFTSTGKEGSKFLTQSQYSERYVTFHTNGKTGRYVKDISGYPEELEVLFPTNTKWYVERVEELSGGHIDIYLSEVL